MGATYALGVIDGAVESDTPRETAIALLRAIAAFAEVAIRDRLADGEVVEVSPSGKLKTLTGETAETLASAIEASANSRPYSAFSYLDGYHVLVPGASGEGEPEDLPDGAERPARRHLDMDHRRLGASRVRDHVRRDRPAARLCAHALRRESARAGPFSGRDLDARSVDERLAHCGGRACRTRAAHGGRASILRDMCDLAWFFFFPLLYMRS